MRAVNAKGTGPWSEVAAAETKAAPPDAPEPVTFAQRTATSVRVKWDFPAEDNGAAVLRYRCAVHATCHMAVRHL